MALMFGRRPFDNRSPARPKCTPCTGTGSGRGRRRAPASSSAPRYAACLIWWDWPNQTESNCRSSLSAGDPPRNSADGPPIRSRRCMRPMRCASRPARCSCRCQSCRASAQHLFAGFLLPVGAVGKVRPGQSPEISGCLGNTQILGKHRMQFIIKLVEPCRDDAQLCPCLGNPAFQPGMM